MSMHSVVKMLLQAFKKPSPSLQAPNPDTKSLNRDT